MSEHNRSEREKTLEVSLALPTDAEGIARVQAETWIATYPNEEAGIHREDIESLHFTGPEYVHNWQRSLETPKVDRQAWVIREEGAVIGYCVARKGGDVNRLQAIYVSPHHQGKGLGKKLMDVALVWLGNEKDVVLDVASYNLPSISFYEHLGFRKTGKDGLHVVPGGSLSIPQTEMRLNLVKHN